LNRFLALAVSLIGTDNGNLQISALVLVREMATHFRIPVLPELVAQLIQCVQVDPFTAQCFLALADQTDYETVLQTAFIDSFVSTLFTNDDPASRAIALRLATRLIASPLFTAPILVSAAKARAYPELLKFLVTLPAVSDLIAGTMLTELDDDVSRDIVFAIGFRASDDFIRHQLASSTRFRSLLLATATPSAIPPFDLEELDDAGRFWISTKLPSFPDGFTPHPVGLAIRGVFTSSFTPDLIPQLLEFENTFDRALSSTDGKFDLFQYKFAYNLGYKEILWTQWHNKLDNDPINLLKLCLLCPPDFFLASVTRFSPFFPIFLQSEFKGSLDLLLFSLMTVENESLHSFLKVIGPVIDSLTTGLSSDSGPIRLDICRVFHIMAVKLPGSAIHIHKSRLSRLLRTVLDDPKREVRKMAAMAVSAWIAIDEKDL
jgi:hypothetical protein